jgi:hypothetical protein
VIKIKTLVTGNQSVRVRYIEYLPQKIQFPVHMLISLVGSVVKVALYCYRKSNNEIAIYF